MFFYASRIVLFFPLLCSIFLSSCGLPGEPGETAPPLKIFFVDVGQGDACLFRSPQGRFYLYDLGNHAEALLAFLAEQRVDTLQSVVVSHPDLDHYGAFAAVLGRFPVKRVHLPHGSSPDSAWLSLIQALDVPAIEKDTLFAGDSLLWDDGLRVKVLWPGKHFSGTDNNLSQVLRIEYAGHSLLLTGDLESDGETTLLASHLTLASDLLKVGHHGSRTSSSLPFLSAVDPEWAIISCDSAVYGHPHAETLAGLRLVMGSDGKVLRTDREGTIGFEIDAEGLRRIGEVGVGR